MKVAQVNFEGKRQYQVSKTRFITEKWNKYRETKILTDVYGNLVSGRSKYPNGDFISAHRLSTCGFLIHGRYNNGTEPFKTILSRKFCHYTVPPLKRVLRKLNKLQTLKA